MKLGLGIGYAGARMDVPITMIQRAEELGYDSVWTAEAYGSDALSPLAYIAALTSRIKLATGIVQLAARTPAATAMAAQTIDQLAGGGRVIIGLGVSGPQIVEGWYGQPWGSPNRRIRDYVAIMKKIFAREAPVTHAGQEIALPYTGPGSSGLAKPLKSILHTDPNLPIYIGAAADVNVRMTAEVADGLLPLGWRPANAGHWLGLINEGLAKRSDGRRLADFAIQSGLSVVVTDDVKGAIDALRPHTALYVGGMGARQKNFHARNMARLGYPEAAERIQELFLAGRKKEAEEAIPADFLDDGALLGPPERIRERWRPWADSGLTGVTISRPSQAAMELMADIARD